MKTPIRMRFEIEDVRVDGRDWHRQAIKELPGHWWIWGFRDGYFIAVAGKEDAAEKLMRG